MKNIEILLYDIKSHRGELAKFGVSQIGIFGSYARDEQTESSDIDILIDFNSEQENFDNLMSVNEYLEQLFQKYDIEIVTKKGLSPYLAEKILGEVIYA
jgi:uncharacterized protein